MEKRFISKIEQLKKSLHEQELQFLDTLILNPVENIPNHEFLLPCSSFLHGIYNTDTVRDNSSKYQSKLQFSGRNQVTPDVDSIYNMWSELLGAKKLSMRLLSGLHAHIVIFMGLSKIGDKVMLLPEKAGGHLSGRAILERLGLQIIEFPYNNETMKIDKEKCLQIIETSRPKFLFVDRSEGLIYEDFSWIQQCNHCYKIFDASQYLTNIIAKDYKNPFDMGFDMVLSTMHKNLPGPQRALVCVKEDNDIWCELRSSISTFVSNMHVFSIYSAGLMLEDFTNLCNLSHNMIENALVLENELFEAGVPAIIRKYDKAEPATHHCWIKTSTQDEAFNLFITLERIGILTNYRLLPYDLGYGLRIGLSGACNSGLYKENLKDLSRIISMAYKEGYSAQLEKNTLNFIREIKQVKKESS